ncbi:MAG: hypothetical protein PHQ74_02015 [Crocinitomicaceae bacterium]|nr:hypothetical protein [Crocinitomicaceae bacterium]
MKKLAGLLFLFIGLTINVNAQLKESQLLKIESQVLKIDQEPNLKSYSVPASEIAKDKKLNTEEQVVVFKNKNKIIKIEYKSNTGQTSEFESFKIYTSKGKPIYIEKQTKEIIHARPINGEPKTFEYLIKSKSHIANWKKNQFEYVLWNEDTGKYEEVKGEMKTTIFMSDKVEVERILRLSRTVDR